MLQKKTVIRVKFSLYLYVHNTKNGFKPRMTVYYVFVAHKMFFFSSFFQPYIFIKFFYGQLFKAFATRSLLPQAYWPLFLVVLTSHFSKNKRITVEQEKYKKSLNKYLVINVIIIIYILYTYSFYYFLFLNNGLK